MIEEVIGGTLILLIVIVLYNMYLMNKIWKSMVWLLKHVHVVSKGDAKDPQFERIKRIFGIEDKDTG